MASRHATWPWAGILGGLVILATGLAPAQAHPSRPGVRVERPSLQERLGLSDEQARAIREVFQRQRAALRETGRALWEARRALRDLALGDGDEAALEAKKAEVQELLRRLEETRTQALRDIAQLLTPEQRERFKELPRLWRPRPAPLAG